MTKRRRENVPVQDDESIKPTTVTAVNQLLVDDFHAIRLDRDDERLITIMEDPFVPPYDTIYGVYCVYRKSILDLLKGKISSVDSYDFKEAFSKDKPLTAEDVEGVLGMATFVVIASEDNTYMSHYFIGGDSDKLNSILNVCFGHPNALIEPSSNRSIKRFEQDVLIVEKMGFMKLLRNE